MSALETLYAAGRPIAESRPWRRSVVDAGFWRTAAFHLAEGNLTLMGLWGDPGAVHMLLAEDEAADVAILSFACDDGCFPSIGALHPPAIRLERAVSDLFGLQPIDIPDDRPWLDHSKPYNFLPVEGDGLHQVPVGPVHAGIIEPGHFRFTANGETVVRLEQRLGYVHKGVEKLMQGADLGRGAQLAGRVSGDSTVAYGFAFARAAEAALNAAPPDRAVWLRALAAELERLANHFGDIGAVCNDASFAMMHAHCAVLRELVLRAAKQCFGHRLMRDYIVPGGVAADLSVDGRLIFLNLINELRLCFAPLVELYDNTPSLTDRTVGTGIVSAELVRRFAAGGFVGRASGRAFDARRAYPYPPYDRLGFEVPVVSRGDVNARVWIRIREVEQSLAIIGQILGSLPSGPVLSPLPAPAAPCEGTALIEGFRGDILVWLQIDADNSIKRCHLRDPSWFQWPLLEAAIEGNIIADFPLCNKSFNCSYSGHDL
jgi:Ni,Fe-hydrogenase III large subunit